MKLLICDDMSNRAKAWETALNEAPRAVATYDIVVPSDDEVITAIITMQARRDAARFGREGKPVPSRIADSDGPCVFDEADLLILDYDLFWLGLHQEGDTEDIRARPRVTGEQLAYLARCFSRCGYIVALNQFGENVFDLNLRGHLRSYADLNIGGEQLGNNNLWGEKRAPYFPSYWPRLDLAPLRQSKQVEFVRQHLDHPILPTFGLVHTDGGYPVISRSAVEFLGATDPLKVTFREFGKSGQPRGLDKTDDLWEEDCLLRIAASRLAKWLERAVLSGQEALVDAPHLVERYPSLAGGIAVGQDAFDAIATNVGTADTFGRDNITLSAHEFPHAEFLSRRAWFWHELVNSREIIEVASPWDTEQASWRFCEDTSSFLEEDLCLSYVADLDSTFVNRQVAGPPALSSARETYPELYSGLFSLSPVEYQPADALAL